jgi:DNA-binding PadR family transcriptional regulator
MNALTNNTATLFRRYLWLLDVIYSAGRITLDEIRVRWQRNEMSGGEELPRKTFENHRKAVEELFDVNIACDRRTNEYYVECGDDLVRDDLRRWLLETFAVNDLLVNSKRLRRRIALEPIPSGYAYLTAVLRAMEENRCLEIVYRHTYDEKREKRYEVEPYGLKAFRRRWYLIANSVEMSGIYAFALDRVRGMVPTAKAAEIPSDFDCAGFFADAFGIIRERDRKAESKSASWGSRRTTFGPCPCTLPSVKPSVPRNIRCSNTGWLRPTISGWNCSRTARTWRYCAPHGSGKR